VATHRSMLLEQVTHQRNSADAIARQGAMKVHT
jgi:hypothetical protein